MKIRKHNVISVCLLLLLACGGGLWFVGGLVGTPPGWSGPADVGAVAETGEVQLATPPDALEWGQGGCGVEGSGQLGAGKLESWAEGMGSLAGDENCSWELDGGQQRDGTVFGVDGVVTDGIGTNGLGADGMGADETGLGQEGSDVPPVLMLAADLHYYSKELTDNGAAFEKWIAGDDGKVSWYSDAMIDAFLEEALVVRPTALILAGDLTAYGEKDNHLRLVEKLRAVQEQGIQILVIPGNHDINSHQAAFYYDGEEGSIVDGRAAAVEPTATEVGEPEPAPEPAPAEAVPVAEPITAAEFETIYQLFGYGQAVSKDESSLSYVYALDERHWALMLDTCQYDPVNLDNGKLSPGTLGWVKKQLGYAQDNGIQVVPIGHHNLLSESRLFTANCTMENHGQLAELLQGYRLPVYISGHLHVQRIKRYQEEPGVGGDARRLYEIVLPPYAIPECRYGWLSWQEGGGMDFQTRAVSVSAWAKRHGSQDGNLLRFDEMAPLWSKQIIKKQILTTLYSLPEGQMETMAALYADIYYRYVKGERLDGCLVARTEGWKLWERMAPDSVYKKGMEKMIKDCQVSHLEKVFLGHRTHF